MYVCKEISGISAVHILNSKKCFNAKPSAYHFLCKNEDIDRFISASVYLEES